MTTKPTNLAIKRTGHVFKCTWTSHGYGSVDFQYRWKAGKTWSKWQKVAASNTSKSVDLDWTDGVAGADRIGQMHPYRAGSYLHAFSFRVRGKKGKKWSAYSSKAMVFYKPDAPSLTIEMDSNIANRAKFEWKSNDDGAKVVCRVASRTKLVPKDGSADWSGWTNRAFEGSFELTEDEHEVPGSAPKKRFFQVAARGVAGDGIREVSHVYAKPNPPAIKSATLDGVHRHAEWTVDEEDGWRPIDELRIRENIGSPDAQGQPEGGSWGTKATIDPLLWGQWDWAGDDRPDADQAIWYSVEAVHDQWETPSNYVMAHYAGPSDPDLTEVTLSDPSTGEVTVTLGSAHALSTVVCDLFMRTDGSDGWGDAVLTIPNGQTSARYVIPDYAPSNAYAFAVRNRNTADWPGNNVSGYVTGGSIGSLPSAPTNVSCADTGVPGEVRLSWEPTMQGANGSVISWADHASAWSSTDGPEEYAIDSSARAWTVAGLETGKTWWFCVRSVSGIGDNQTKGPWSEPIAWSLAESPVTPSLYAPAYVTVGTGAYVEWTYASNDGTAQRKAVISDMGTEVGSTESTIQHLTIGEGWEAGTTHELRVRTCSESGQWSDWSAPAYVTVANAPSCSIVTHLTTVPNLDDDGNPIMDAEGNPSTVNHLTALPLTVDVSGSDGGTSHAMIVKQGAAQFANPDGTTTNLWDGQVMGTFGIQGDGTITVEGADLGLMEGQGYALRCWVVDGYGQVAYAEDVPFVVAWARHAATPSMTVDATTYASRGAVILTPSPGEGSENDRCDIYRVSADGASLLVPNAAWGTSYVDPYAVYGGIEGTGHRCVCVTPEGDMTTASGDMAWYDTSKEEGDELHAKGLVLDWEGQTLALPWNNSVSDSYSKDFTRRTHLGGSVTGHWNPSIERDRRIGTQMVKVREEQDVMTLRSLAQHAGSVHVRTQDGVSIAANVSVEEVGREYGSMALDVSLTVNEVDNDSPEGLTLAAYQEGLA